MSLAKTNIDVTLLQQQGEAAKAKAAGAKAAESRKAARQAAEDFEALFLAQMLQPMFKGLEADALFGGGPGEDVYKSMLVQEYGKAISRAGGVGIADAVQAEILKLQEVAGK